MSTSVLNLLIEKLSNNIEEIRLLALREINGKLQNSHSENDLVFNGPFLVKSLIRWFGNVPLKEEGTALNTILLVLGSSSGGDIIHFLKADRILSELNKIEFFLHKPDHLRCLNEIREEIRRKVEMADNSQPNDLHLDLSLSALTERLNINESGVEEGAESPSTDLIKCWELPGTTDLNRMTAIKQSLLRPETGQTGLRETLSLLPAMIRDMPGEYFLQPPYLYRNLFQLLDAQSISLTGTIKLLNDNLIGRIKYRQLAATYRRKEERDEVCCNQIGISRYISECFKCVLVQLKACQSHSSKASVVNQCLTIFSQLVEMAIQDPYGQTATYDLLMGDLSDLCRYFRNTMGVNEEDFIYRKYYLQVLDCLVKLIRRRDVAAASSMNYCPNDFQEAQEEPIAIEVAHSWSSEIRIALLDVSIKTIYPQLYESILMSAGEAQLKNCFELGTLLHCESELQNTVKLLRDWQSYSNEELIFLAPDSLALLSIHESAQLVRCLMKAIYSLNGKFCSDGNLRRAAERVLLQLFSYPDTALKRIAYQEAANYMKIFFSSLVDGERSVAKLQKEAEKALGCCNLGLPMTTEILTEILCVGYTHNEGNITAQSEAILTLIVKGRSVLGRYWKTVQCVLIPILPLLQAITNSYSSLGKSIVEMFDPDPMELPFNEILLGNIRFMFNEDAAIRQEALVRLMYIVDSRPEAKDYTPDIRQLGDSIHDDICVLEAAVDVTRKFSDEGHFDQAAIYSLINVLKDENLNNLAVRKSALMQLNSMAMDPKLNLMIHDLDAWYSILVVMDNAMKEESKMDCPESVIPAVNIFAKMCLQIPAFRLEMAKEMKILMLLFRSLLKYHHMAAFRPDCVLALFLLSHTDFIIGSINLSTPLLFSKLLLPFVAKSYHWIESPFYQPSKLEEAVAAVLQKRTQTARTSRQEPTSLYDFKLKLSAGMNRDPVSETGSEAGEELGVVERDAAWQYLRISFASLWFNGFDKLIEKASGGLNYSADGSPLDFNENLKVIKSDLTLIGNTMPVNAFQKSIAAIQNATSHTDVVNGLMNLDCVLRLSPNIKFNMKSLAKSLQRFCVTIPSSPMDEELFGSVLSFLTQALDSRSNGEDLQSWAMREFKQSHCNFVGLLTRRSTRELFEGNAKFLNRLLNCLVDSQRSKEAKKVGLILMNHVLDGIEERYTLGEMENVNSLLLILRTMLTRLPHLLEDYSDEFALNLADRLLAYSVTSKITSRTGSTFLKNTLMTICKLGQVIPKFRVDKKHYNLIIGLTGHTDMEIRVLTWNILEMLSSQLETARLLPEQLVDIPGGLHSFALSTALEESEADLVRELAAVVLANLLSHVDQNGQMAICPVAGAQEDEGSVLIEMLNQHQFVDRMLEFIRVFSPTELVDIECNDQLAYCGTIRGLVTVLNSLLRLEESILEHIFFTSNLGLELLNVINLVPADVTPNSLELAAEICKFLLAAESVSEPVRERIILSNRSIVGSLVYLLNVNMCKTSLFIPQSWQYGVVFLEMLRQIIITDHGYGMLCQVLEQNDNGRDFINTLLVGLRVDDERLQVGIMNFLQVTLNMALNGDPLSINFLSLMDLNSGKTERRPTANGFNNIENMDPNRPKEIIKSEKIEMDEVPLTRFVFDEIHSHFRSINSKSSIKKKSSCYKVLSIFLNASKEARWSANVSGLFEEIMQRYREIMEVQGSSCPDFVRRHGEVKKTPIVDELEMLFDLLVGWFAVESLLNVEQVESLTQLVIKSWSWIATNQKLQLKFVRLLVLLSEDSVPVCKSFARQYSTVSPSVVQLLCQMIHQEMTTKVKHPKFNIALLRTCVRVLSNCCCCIEGRLLVGKLNVMDHMDRLHPQVTKWQEPWVQITELWLEFWEVYSRYPEGGRLSHQSLLLTIVHKDRVPKITLKALTILRNMAFVGENRISLLNSEDYIDMLKFVLDSEKAPHQQLMLVIVAIWKLLANSFKAKNKLKGTTIPQKLIALKNRVAGGVDGDGEELRDEILLILDIVNSTLSN